MGNNRSLVRTYFLYPSIENYRTGIIEVLADEHSWNELGIILKKDGKIVAIYSDQIVTWIDEKI